MYIDARKLDNNSIIEGDICIIGAGTTGISIALDWIDTPYKVVLLEGGGFEYDDRGEIASRGTFLMQLEADLRMINYYKQKPPKSLGLEWVQQEIFPRLESSKRNPKDLLKTFTDHCAWAIARVIPKGAKVLVTGGGAYNDYLISKMRRNKAAEFIIPEKNLIEFKEALIFAFLGLLRLDNQINCLKSVTGAKKDHSSGQIYVP